MKQSTRLFTYCIVGIPIPLLVAVIYRDYLSALSFFGIVLVLAVAIEVVYKIQGKK